MSDSTAAARPDVLAFIVRWKASKGSERANYSSSLSELCAVIGVPQSEPTRPDVSQNAYVFERDVVFQNPDGSTSHGRIDLYKRGCFVLEAKQGSEQPDAGADELSSPAQPPKKIKMGTAVRGTKGWDDAMLRAFGQAEQYARERPGDVSFPISPETERSDQSFAVDETWYADIPRPGALSIRPCGVLGGRHDRVADVARTLSSSSQPETPE